MNKQDFDSHPTFNLNRIQVGDLVIDPFAQEIQFNGKSVKLTRIEFRILWILGSNPHRVFSREELLQRVWGPQISVEPRTVDAHIARLRRLFRKDKDFRLSIETVWGIGYCLRKLIGRSEDR